MAGGTYDVVINPFSIQIDDGTGNVKTFDVQDFGVFVQPDQGTDEFMFYQIALCWLNSVWSYCAARRTIGLAETASGSGSQKVSWTLG